MRSLASVVALSTNTGTRCSLSLIQGLLRNGMPLDMWCEDSGWKQLTNIRKVIPTAAEADIYLHTADRCAYLTEPGDLIRVRFTKGR